MEQHIIYVGLDVHKDTIAVALAEAGKRGEVREHGKIVNTPAALKTLATKLARNGYSLRFCYEAGPCGYGIQRQLSEAGYECVVVAHRSGFQTRPMKRSAIWCARDWPQCVWCVRRASNCPASRCAMAIIMSHSDWNALLLSRARRD